MSQILSEVLKSNGRYASNFGEKGKLGLPPARGFAILTCMDARLDPAKYAGGRASDDAIRSLVISYKLLGTREFLSYTTPIAAWNFSPMTSCAGCWIRVLKLPS